MEYLVEEGFYYYVSDEEHIVCSTCCRRAVGENEEGQPFCAQCRPLA